MEDINLFASTSRVETPFIKVSIGDYTFGVYSKSSAKVDKIDAKGIYKSFNVSYPNYIQSLNIKKLNGLVNNYTLQIKYPITESSDPNFFEKVFSSVSRTRNIKFSYGDVSSPSFIFKEEEAIIMNIKTSFDLNVITYTINAISSSTLSRNGNNTFPSRFAKPSDVIKEILWANGDIYGLQQIFYGMRNKTLVENNHLIYSNDVPVKLETKVNISILDYLDYLVSSMIPLGEDVNAIKNKTIFVLRVFDDVSSVYGGPYFSVSSYKNIIEEKYPTAYEINVGYPSSNIVVSFSANNDESYSLLYDYNENLSSSDYVERIDDKGNTIRVFSPSLISDKNQFEVTPTLKKWWSEVTSFPIKATIQLKGLLRPSILMTHVKLNVLFYGRKHISSGIYIITSQTDDINDSGYRTTLTLTRVSGDPSINIQ